MAKALLGKFIVLDLLRYLPSSFPFVTRAKLHLFEINHPVKIRNFAKVANKWQNIPKVQNRGEGRGSTIFSPFCILMLTERFGMLRCLVNTFFFTWNQSIYYIKTLELLSYMLTSIPLVWHTASFFAELPLKALI